MKNLIVEQIERRARLEHGGDFSKAAAEYFRDHSGYYEEVAGVNRRVRSEAEQYADACILAARYRGISIEELFKREPEQTVLPACARRMS
jgi:hypothetical protein